MISFCFPLVCMLYFLHVIFPLVLSLSTKNVMQNFPAPNTPHNRIMGFVLAYNLYHIDPMILILNEYVSMCEAGWIPTVVFFTTTNWSPKLRRYFEQKSFCYAINSTIEIRASLHDVTINIALGAEHRKYLGQELYNYDLFIYHEDDMVFKLSHVHAYLEETKRLHNLLPDNGLSDHTIGFQRYRRIGRGVSPEYFERDVFEQEMLEEMPSLEAICINDSPYLRVGGNMHQAVWIFTQQQIHILQERCGFMNQTSASREYMSSFSLFDRKKYHCGLTKLLPAERLYTFGVLHYFQQRHISWTSLFFADENIRAGYHYASVPRVQEARPDCWSRVVSNSIAEQTRPDSTINETLVLV